MTIREQMEEREKKLLSPYAAHSVDSKGRDREEPQCDIRPVYQRDRDRIIHCKAFRRLKNKTQVFLDPKGDHYRTRMSHTLEVSQNARTIAKALRLNEDLVEAIALGHDLGHTPFGHCGERVLDKFLEGGFKHNEQSVRVVEKLEKDGRGLNLTWEVRDGILNHELNLMPSTLEGRVVRLSDKIAYTCSDIEDAIRAKILTEEELPKEYTDILGHTTRERLNTCIHDIIINSEDKDDICLSSDVMDALMGLRKFMFENVYTNPIAKAEEIRAYSLLEQLFDFYMKNTSLLPPWFESRITEEENAARVVCDYIAGMTDQYAVNKFKEYFMPKAWEFD
ncbi:MAG: deoxyguanosinetriphosphate triphosphohydrolase [Lachnospiraceae bacterium]|nr:deoxyguanosinetriphosphate triphosphohydrolase [Lachnospiraceae bacterium]